MGDTLKMAVEDPIVMMNKNTIVDWGLTQRHRNFTRNNKVVRDFAEKHVKKIE